jgi:FlaG/FlaF family flagellin (archaellin)
LKAQCGTSVAVSPGSAVRPLAAADRANATVGAVLLVAVAVALAGAVGAAVLDADPAAPPRAAVEASADADSGRIALTHLGGDALDVRDVAVRVFVDGEPLAHQPPVPFFAAEGFRGGPTGPFNSAADPGWEPGETASVRVASTNAPALAAGATVTVVVSVDDATVTRATTTA